MKKIFSISHFVEKYFDNFSLIMFLVGWINVEWDTGLSLLYRYGNDGIMTAYDIEPSDEPRILLEDQPIAVGCLVRRGKIS